MQDELNKLSEEIKYSRYPYSEYCPCNGCICETVSKQLQELVAILTDKEPPCKKN